MSMSIIGNNKGQEILLPNGMKIKIEYSGGPGGAYGSEKYMSACRRVTLFDSKGRIISRLVEKNPEKVDTTGYYSMEGLDPDILY